MCSIANDVFLDAKLVGDIAGKFFVPDYQRGYRWSTQEVTMLLDDVLNASEAGTGKNYCLQPIVVRKKENGDFELIDGQQRLTTIYLIYKYISKFIVSYAPTFSIEYQTRHASKLYLDSIDLSKKNDNIDFWHMARAYECISKWKGKDNIGSLIRVCDAFAQKVKIIWYEVGVNEAAVNLFTRLNIGKIPLTSSELIKAMFLSRNNLIIKRKNIDEQDIKNKQLEIALEWDRIEKELHNNSFWSFLTNRGIDYFPTRIDLILNLIADVDDDDTDKYASFFYFDNLRQNSNDNEILNKLWKDIVKAELKLYDWYNDHDCYHKIGYLIASDSKSLREIFRATKGMSKHEITAYLDESIRNSINVTKANIKELNYTKHYNQIKRILTLFNVESVRIIDGRSQRFSFENFKGASDKKTIWTLEHIHAQQSKGFKADEELWMIWLAEHNKSLKALDNKNQTLSALIEEIEEYINKKKRLSKDSFDMLRIRVINQLSEDLNEDYVHFISNMALLSNVMNTAINNSAFDVKRNQIIKMDKEGKYIPLCTKMVFLKYYSDSEGNQLHFWGVKDREAYYNAIIEVLNPYLLEDNEEIELKDEEE